jgi:hypothetical protein
VSLVSNEPPEVVGDLDPDREVIRSVSELAIHLPERGDTCLVVRLGDSGRRCQAGTQFDDAPLCRDCARGEALADVDTA